MRQYGCSGGSCGSYMARPPPLFKHNYVSPDKIDALTAKPHDIMDQFKQMNRVGYEQSGGFRPGPNPEAGYSSGNSNSGSVGLSAGYIDGIAAARRNDFEVTYK